MNSKSGKKIVLTGAGGFLGSHIIGDLEENKEYFVYALSSRGEQLQHANTKDNIQFCEKNAIFSDIGAKILENAIVVNCAFPRNTDGFAMGDGLRYIQRLFERSAECNAEAIINISSQSVYSQMRKEPATEETPVCLESSYAVGKYATELMLEMACKDSALRFTNLRMSSLIGAGFNQRIVNKIILKALNGEPITVIRSRKTFVFLDVRDAAKAICKLLLVSPERWERVYNVGNGNGYTLIDIYEAIRKVLLNQDIPFPKTIFESEDSYASSAVNGEKLYLDTGFCSEISLERSIEIILNALTFNR